MAIEDKSEQCSALNTEMAATVLKYTATTSRSAVAMDEEKWQLSSATPNSTVTTSHSNEGNEISTRSISDEYLETDTDTSLKKNVSENKPAAARGIESSSDQKIQNNASLVHQHDHNIEIHDIPPTATSSRCVGRRNTVVMKFLIPTLLILVGIKYQVSPDFLFLTNAVQLWCFLGSLCLYWPTIQIIEKWSHVKYINMLSNIVVACEVLSVFSLMSLLLPLHLSLPVFITSISLGLALLAVIMVVSYIFGSE